MEKLTALFVVLIDRHCDNAILTTKFTIRIYFTLCFKVDIQKYFLALRAPYLYSILIIYAFEHCHFLTYLNY